MIIERSSELSLRPLERTDLRFVHEVNNNAKIMRYWFEEPYAASWRSTTKAKPSASSN